MGPGALGTRLCCNYTTGGYLKLAVKTALAKVVLTWGKQSIRASQCRERKLSARAVHSEKYN